MTMYPKKSEPTVAKQVVDAFEERKEKKADKGQGVKENSPKDLRLDAKGDKDMKKKR